MLTIDSEDAVVEFDHGLINDGRRKMRSIVACIGSSSTAGKGQAFNWIDELSNRPQNSCFAFRNFGIGGDLAFNVHQRLSDVIACRPSKVIVLVGGNDVLALVSSNARRFFRITKRIPVEPSPEWFRENLQSIAHILKTQTLADIGLCSLVPIGEAPSSSEPFQAEINRGIAQYSQLVKDVAEVESTGYIAIYEAITTRLVDHSGKAFHEFRFLPIYLDAFRALVLRKGPDEIAQLNGWKFHSDGIHLNKLGGKIVADLVQEFLDR